MFFLKGTRTNGHTVDKNYKDESIARFEFDVTKCVASNLTLYNESKIIDEYHLELENQIQYILQGQSAFNELNMQFDKIENATQAFESEKERCNWLVLYKVENDSMNQLKLYVKQGVA